jgi:hypothetical protein
MPQPLYPQGKSPWYPLDRKLSGPQSRSGNGGEEEISQHKPGLEPPIIHPVAQGYTEVKIKFQPKKKSGPSKQSVSPV